MRADQTRRVKDGVLHREAKSRKRKREKDVNRGERLEMKREAIRDRQRER